MLIAVFRLKTQDECLAQIGQQAGEKGTSEKKCTSSPSFLLVLVVEVIMGGWMVTYIIDVRGGGPSSGYISSGFWGGLMTGRIVGERRVCLFIPSFAIGLELVVWLVPSLIGGGVAIFIVWWSAGWMAGFGQAGSALFPFLNRLISMMAFMTILWALVPRTARKAG
ncbi:hypothetical protein BDR07DRAFT_1430916 [Suillus spraguei]|nr:hypothetical protein BDR07DRAFT_1430916 [Suillus spraguei]